MTTRMLFRSLMILIFSLGLVSCSLFGPGEDEALTPDQLDSSSISNADDLDGDEGIDGLENSDEVVSDEEAFGEDGDILDGEDDFGEDVASDDDAYEDPESAMADEFNDLESDSDFTESDTVQAFNDTEDSGGLEASADIVEDELGGEFDDGFGDQAAGEESLEGETSEEETFAEDAGGEDEFAVSAEGVPQEPESAFDEPDEGEVAIDASEAPVASNEVVNLEYKSFENGGTVVIETASPVTYNVREEPDLNQVIVEVEGVNLPEKFKRPYITKDFKQDVATINAYQGGPGDTARFVIQMKRPLKPTVQQSENSILVMTSELPPGGEDGMQIATSPGGIGEAPTGDEAFAGERQYDQLAQGSQGAGSEVGLPEDSNNLGAVTYKGQKINLEVVDTDIREVVQIISEESGVNLIMDQDVKGQVSFRLRQVPWDQALMVVLKSQALGYKRQGNVLRIAKQETLSNEAQQISKQIENEKQARLLAGGLKVKYIPISYAKVDVLETKLKQFSSKDGKVTFDNRTSSVVVSDYEEYINRITKLAKAMDIPPMQVEIEAKIVEASEDFRRETGFNWGASGESFSIGGGQTGSVGVNSTPVTTTTNPGLSMDLEFGTFDIFGSLTASLSLFENQNKVKVLSAPKILAMNKVPAKVVQNTQIPIQQISQGAGGNIQGITYQDLILSLVVTPQITFRGDVIMDVNVKREFASSPDETGNREINTREAESTVMVRNGHTAVIGGIYQNDSATGSRGVPILKDIPFLGALFRQSTTENTKNELLVFLKPRVLSVEAAGALAKGDPATDFQQLESLNVDEGGGDEDFSDDGEDISDFEDGGIDDDFDSEFEEETL